MMKGLYHQLLRRRQRLSLVAHIGDGSRIELTARFEHHHHLEIGRYCRIGPGCFLSAEGGITIGDGTILGPNVTIYSSTHRYDQTVMLPYDDLDEARPVTIGRGVWLAHGVLVAPGSVIEDGVVAGLGAVVSGKVSAGSVVVGNPARVVASRDHEGLNAMISEQRYYMKLSVENRLTRKLVVDASQAPATLDDRNAPR